MYNIKDIKHAKFLLFQKTNSAFGRMVLSCVQADFLFDTAFNITYKALFQISQKKQFECKLVYYKKNDTWYLEQLEEESNISYKLVDCTNNFVQLLEVNDIFTYFEEGQYHGFKVIGIYPQHKAIYVMELNTKKRYRIGTIMKRFDSTNIISIKKQEKGA